MTTTPITLRRRGVMLIVSSPSGAGKTTISRLLLEREKNLTMSISVTTRPRRPSEISGRDYHFIDRAEYDRMVEREEFLEHAEVFGNGYGTPRPPVERALAAGRDILFDVDWQGTRQMAKSVRADMVSVFILPPSYAELERRLRTRAQDSDEASPAAWPRRPTR
jgi:guanylate kinase